MTLPLALSTLVSMFSAGYIVSATGYYSPAMILGSILMACGAGLMTSMETDSSPAAWIGYQLLVGFGGGMSFQQPFIALQTVLAAEDIPRGMALIAFAQSFGSAISLSVADNIFSNRLRNAFQNIESTRKILPADLGAASLSSELPPSMLSEALIAVGHALTPIFYLSLVAASFMTLVGIFGIPWRSVKSGSEGDVTQD
jgi:hypothetical protein